MSPDKKALIKYTIVLPITLKLLLLDRKHFENHYASNAYLNLFDTMIERIQYDITYFRGELFHKYHIIIQEIKTENGTSKYKLIKHNQSKIISYTPDELKTMTTNVIREYMQGSNAFPYKIRDRQWKQLDMMPPEADLSNED